MPLSTFPSYVKVGFPQSEEPGTAVMRSEMDRGVAKQRRIVADVMVTEDVIVYFDTKQQAADWLTWFYSDISAGADWFLFDDLRTGETLEVRIVEGKPGALKPSTVTWAYSQRTIKIEWLRSAL